MTVTNELVIRSCDNSEGYGCGCDRERCESIRGETSVWAVRTRAVGIGPGSGDRDMSMRACS